MKLCFTRHGEGEHTLQPPDSLHTYHPSLTELGVQQARNLRESLDVESSDLIVASPTLRTIQTAIILAHHSSQIIVHPYVGPRIFPYKEEIKTLPCDIALSASDVQKHQIKMKEGSECGGEGVNKVSEDTFTEKANSFLDWCKEMDKERILIVTHDGTITRYREEITGKSMSREDFLKDAGWIEVEWDESSKT